jgi:hypothetical protein
LRRPIGAATQITGYRLTLLAVMSMPWSGIGAHHKPNRKQRCHQARYFFQHCHSILPKRSGRVNGVFRFASHVKDEPLPGNVWDREQNRRVSTPGKVKR